MCWNAAAIRVESWLNVVMMGVRVNLRPLERCRIGHNWIMARDTTDQDACALN